MGQNGYSVYYNDDYATGRHSEEYLKKKNAEAIRMRNSLQRCPICNAYESVITNAHCVSQHGMTKKEVEANYSKIKTQAQIFRENRKAAEEGKSVC